eukprot:5510499-Pyramimonas_sp.AAC.1
MVARCVLGRCGVPQTVEIAAGASVEYFNSSQAEGENVWSIRTIRTCTEVSWERCKHSKNALARPWSILTYRRWHCCICGVLELRRWHWRFSGVFRSFANGAGVDSIYVWVSLEYVGSVLRTREIRGGIF